MMTAYIRFASLNPYWYVPPDLAGERRRANACQAGPEISRRAWLRDVSDWTDEPDDHRSQDDRLEGASRDGKVEVLIRQKPGPKNSMGRIKFMFPNQFGRLPARQPAARTVQAKSSRFFSGGCVRLEDASRLSRWLFGRELDLEGAGTEEPVPLASPVPVYITYLTAMPDGPSIAYFDDVYGRDAATAGGNVERSGDCRGRADNRLTAATSSGRS